jgi:hypothetical protein
MDEKNTVTILLKFHFVEEVEDRFPHAPIIIASPENINS